jgi:adenosylhomocysteine nucleosidase
MVGERFTSLNLPDPISLIFDSLKTGSNSLSEGRGGVVRRATPAKILPTPGHDIYLTNLNNAGIRLVAQARLEVSVLAIMGAFGQEIVDLRRQMLIEEAVTGQGFRLYRGKLKNKDTLLVQTGMGKQRAENATQFVLEHYPITAIISLGFAGALNPELRIGEVVVCSTLYGQPGSGQEGQRLEPLAPDASLLSLASQEPGGRLGSGVSVLELNSSTREMQGLSETYHADIVDMESYWIARMASARHIPFIAIRSISDNIQSSVQPFDRILSSDGEVLWSKAALCFLLHPWYLLNVFTLYKNTRPAKRNLAAFVGDLATKI